MNEAPSQKTGLGDTFGSQQSPQSNPFTADLKGEFSSNFGTNTNAVSQIFKEGGFVSQSRAKYIAIGGVVIVLAAVLFFVFSGQESSDGEDAAQTAESGEQADEPSEEAAAEGEKDEEDKAATTATEEAKPQGAAAPAVALATPAAVAKPVVKGESFGSGTITLSEPADGSSLLYDESQGPAQFSWTGGGGTIVFSRNPKMRTSEMRIRVNGNSYAFHHPWPGTWYWRVENRAGKTDIRSFTVGAPQRRSISLSQPTSGGSVGGNGGTVSWQGDSRVASYRVEFSNGGWANPNHRFASSGNSVQLQGVAPGQYQMRVGAFSEVAGRWEYTTPISVTVQ